MSGNSNDDQEQGGKSLAAAFQGGLGGFPLGGGLGALKAMDMSSPKLAVQKNPAMQVAGNKHTTVTHTAKTSFKPHGVG